MDVPGCVAGKHSDTPPAQELERQAAIKEATSKAMEVHASSEKPTAAGAAPPPRQTFAPSAATVAKPAKPKRPPLPEGQARCRHAGCQNVYTIADNHASACTYHAAAPLFHEGSKTWPCCRVKKWDFDDFLAVPGCVTGPHEPVAE